MCAWNCTHAVSAFQTTLQIPEEVVFKDVDGNKYSLRNAHMGQHSKDAVSYWVADIIMELSLRQCGNRCLTPIITDWNMN